MSNILVTRSSMPSLDEYVEEIKDIDQFILLNTHKTNVKTK